MSTPTTISIAKVTSETVLSGSFCVTGKSLVEATSVGEKSYANELTQNAREFKKRGVRSRIAQPSPRETDPAHHEPRRHPDRAGRDLHGSEEDLYQ